jgi:hypothetical protein
MSDISDTLNGDVTDTDSVKPSHRKGNNAPLGYVFFRTIQDNDHLLFIGWFFKIMLNIFYSSIIVENEEFVPPDGNPCIICANHSNSVMDAVVLVTSVSRSVFPIMMCLMKEKENAKKHSKGYNCQW